MVSTHSLHSNGSTLRLAFHKVKETQPTVTYTGPYTQHCTPALIMFDHCSQPDVKMISILGHILHIATSIHKMPCGWAFLQYAISKLVPQMTITLIYLHTQSSLQAEREWVQVLMMTVWRGSSDFKTISPSEQHPDSSPATSRRRHQIEATPCSITLFVSRSDCVCTKYS